MSYEKNRLESIFLRMINCSSISGTKEEINMAREIYAIVQENPYFQQNPQYLSLNPIPGDALGRYFVTALVKGRGDRTVILINHHDIVDYEGYGQYRNLALDPKVLTAELDPNSLPEEAKEDLLSGEWLFGRGVMDMKCGGALQISLMDEITQDIERFEGNILFVSVPDEENNSAGMLGAVPKINEIKETYGLAYTAVVNSEPHHREEGLHDLFIGAIGKVLPIFYCMGKETHAGELLEGLSADSLLSEIERGMQLNMNFVDEADGEYTMPPTVLKMGDTKEHYNVSTPATAYAYYNVFSLKRSPKEILEMVKGVAQNAFDNGLDKFRKVSEEYSTLTGKKYPCPWETKVFTYDEMYQMNKEALGASFEEHMKLFIQANQGIAEDERDFAIKVIGEVVRLSPDRDPKIVVAFAPPYYPHLRNKGESQKEKHLMGVVDRLQKYGKESFDMEWRVNRFHKGISDMSYCGLQDAQDVLLMLKPNMPTFGYSYTLPLEEMAKLNVPVVNVGPWGKDAHKFTERLHMPFAYEIAPQLLKFTVMGLLEE